MAQWPGVIMSEALWYGIRAVIKRYIRINYYEKNSDLFQISWVSKYALHIWDLHASRYSLSAWSTHFNSAFKINSGLVKTFWATSPAVLWFSTPQVLQALENLCKFNNLCHKLICRCKPLLFAISVTGFFYVHYTTHETYGFSSHPKGEAIMVKCLA